MVANETLITGTNIKQGWLYAFDLNTFEQTAKSSHMLPEAITCMCVGDDPSTLIVGMNEAKIASVRAGRGFLEVLGSFSLAHSVKTFHSITKSTRGDYALGTTTGICFVKWMPVEKRFDVVRQVPTSSQGPALTLLSNRQTLSLCEAGDDIFVTSDYNQAGYYVVNRATKEVKKLEDKIVDNRGCFDIAPLPNFHLTDFPFVLMKARKGVILANVTT